MDFDIIAIIEEQVSNYLQENELLNEGISDIAYHFTNYSNLLDILKNNEFILSNALSSPREEVLNKGKFYFLSTTRSRKSGFSIGPVKLVLDAKKLSEKYKILPVKFFTNIRDSRGSEQEDRVISNSKIIPNATSYIKEIHMEALSSGTNYKKYMMKLISNIEIRDIPYFVYKYRADFLDQTNSLKGKDLARLLPTQNMVDKNTVSDSNIPYSELLYKCFSRDIVGFSALLSINNANNLNSIKNYLRKHSEDELKYKKMERKLHKTISDLETVRDENYNSFFYFITETLVHVRANYKCREFEIFLYKLLSKEIESKKVKNAFDYFFIKKYKTNKSLSQYKFELETYLISILNKAARVSFEKRFPYWVSTPSGRYENALESPEIATLKRNIVNGFAKEIKESLKSSFFDFDSDFKFEIDYLEMIPSFPMKASDEYNKQLPYKLDLNNVNSKKILNEILFEIYLDISSKLEFASINKIAQFKKEYS